MSEIYPLNYVFLLIWMQNKYMKYLKAKKKKKKKHHIC